MNGLSFILNVYGLEAKDLAQKLGVSKTGVSLWVNGKRNIPQTRLEQISAMFKSIPIKYFQKELLKSEELEIQMIYLNQKDTTEIAEVPVLDENGNIIAWHVESYSANAGMIDILDNKQAIAVITEKVEELVADDEEAKRLIHDFLNILEKGKRNHIEFLTELLIYLNAKKETLFMEKYVDLEQYLKKHNLISDESAH